MEKGKYYKIISPSNVHALHLGEVWQYRDLVFLLVKKEFVSKYKQTILGPAWAIIQPLLTTVVFTFIFGNVAGLANCGDVPQFLFYMSGNIFWQFFSGCLTGTANTFIANSATMGKVYFPRLCVPISIALNQLIALSIQLILFVGILLIHSLLFPNVVGTNTCIMLIPAFVLQMAMLGFGCGIIISAATTKYRDLQFLVSFGVSLWMYATPIAYSMDIFKSNGLAYLICRFNPITPIIEAIRFAFLGSEAGVFDGVAFLFGLIMTIVIVVMGVFYFNKVEKSFMDTV